MESFHVSVSTRVCSEDHETLPFSWLLLLPFKTVGPKTPMGLIEPKLCFAPRAAYASLMRRLCAAYLPVNPNMWLNQISVLPHAPLMRRLCVAYYAQLYVYYCFRTTDTMGIIGL